MAVRSPCAALVGVFAVHLALLTVNSQVPLSQAQSSWGGSGGSGSYQAPTKAPTSASTASPTAAPSPAPTPAPSPAPPALPASPTAAPSAAGDSAGSTITGTISLSVENTTAEEVTAATQEALADIFGVDPSQVDVSVSQPSARRLTVGQAASWEVSYTIRATAAQAAAAENLDMDTLATDFENQLAEKGITAAATFTKPEIMEEVENVSAAASTSVCLVVGGAAAAAAAIIRN